MTTDISSAANARKFAVKPDAFFVRNDDGVWLRNNAGSFAIRGAGAYELVESLFTHLDGERTVDDLCSGLPQGARQSVARLVETLAGNGFLKESTHPAEHVPEWMRERYPAHLAFLDQHADRPVARMTKVRTRLVVCAGSGAALRALLGAVAEFGMARVLVLSPDEGMAAAVAEAKALDPQFRWELRATDLADVADAPEVAEAAQVLLALDDDDATAIAGVQHALRSRGLPVGVLGRCGDFVAATAPAAADEWCWECLHRCVAAPVTGDARGLPLAAAPLTLAALHLVQHVFAALAEVDLPGADAVTTVEPLAPVVRMHTGRRHPRCGRHGRQPVTTVDRAVLRDEPVRPDIPGSRDPDALVEVSDRIVVASTGWTDHVVGPLLGLDEGAESQLPLSTSTCRVAALGNTASAQDTTLFSCHAISPREARNQVVLHALEWLARSSAPDEPVVFGAGWTSAEAWYRAALAASAAIEPDSLTWQPVTRQPFAAHPIRDFLADTLAADGRAWVATAVEHLPTGFVRARVRTADFEVAGGLGIDPDHAVRNALLQAVAAELPSAGLASTAHLAPPVDTWLAAVELVGGPAEPRDVAADIGFPGACVLAMPLGGSR